MLHRSFYLFLLFCSQVALGNDEVTQCVMQQYLQAQGSTTIEEIKKVCQPEPADPPSSDLIETIKRPVFTSTGAISERIIKESRTEFDPYVITPHKINYILPAMTTNNINKDAYRTLNGYEDNLEDIEAKFQISLKVPLNNDALFIEGDGLYFGFTLQAWWQLYADNISKPFRETNYQPEIFYLAPLSWHPFGGNTGFVVGIEHQSNGRAQDLSRSWNRIYTHFLYEKDSFALSFRPWYRLKEDKKTFPLDPDGDDNPDIDDFMGHFELGMVYKWEQVQFSFLGRQNFATHNGAAEIGITFPLWGKLRGYATVFNGYGDSLIDYNYNQTRFGIGIALNDVL